MSIEVVHVHIMNLSRTKKQQWFLTHWPKKKKHLFPVSKYNIDIQNAYKHQIIITAYRRLPESFYKLSMLATYNTW